MASLAHGELQSRSQGKPPNPPFPLRSAWPRRSAWPSSASMRVGLPYSEETPENPFSDALGLAAALGFLLHVGVLCCVEVGRKKTSPLRSSWPSWPSTACVRASWIVVVGGDPRTNFEPPFSPALGLAAAFDFWGQARAGGVRVRKQF